jgi:hypothetical protein
MTARMRRPRLAGRFVTFANHRFRPVAEVRLRVLDDGSCRWRRFGRTTLRAILPFITSRLAHTAIDDVSTETTSREISLPLLQPLALLGSQAMITASEEKAYLSF